MTDLIFLEAIQRAIDEGSMPVPGSPGKVIRVFNRSESPPKTGEKINPRDLPQRLAEQLRGKKVFVVEAISGETSPEYDQ